VLPGAVVAQGTAADDDDPADGVNVTRAQAWQVVHQLALALHTALHCECTTNGQRGTGLAPGPRQVGSIWASPAEVLAAPRLDGRR
jgi:hypothetical protein